MRRRGSPRRPEVPVETGAQIFDVSMDEIVPDSWNDAETHWLLYLVKNVGADFGHLASVYFGGKKTPQDLEAWYIFLTQLSDTFKPIKNQNNIIRAPQPIASASDDAEDEPAGAPQKKRARKKALDVIRKFKCPVESCIRAYGSESALKLHVRQKHDMHYLPPRPEASAGPTLSNPLAAAAAIADHLQQPEAVLQEVAQRSRQVEKALESLEARVEGLGGISVLPQPIVSTSTTLTPMLPKAHLSTTLPPEKPAGSLLPTTAPTALLFPSSPSLPPLPFTFSGLTTSGFPGVNLANPPQPDSQSSS